MHFLHHHPLLNPYLPLIIISSIRLLFKAAAITDTQVIIHIRLKDRQVITEHKREANIMIIIAVGITVMRDTGLRNMEIEEIEEGVLIVQGA